jgi:thioredoxin reductase (NADPH)
MYDVIIIGSGPAGLTAAVYTTRASLKTLIIAGAKWGGQLQLTTEVDNFPGFPQGIQGPDLMNNMRKQAERFGAEFIDDDFPGMDFSKVQSPFTIKIGDKEVQGKAVLIATGAETKWLGIPGEQERIGRGVSSCAPCDAPFFRNKKVIVVGGGDSAMEEACVLSQVAEHVTVLYRGETLRASQIMQDKAKKNQKISIIYNTVITEILGDNRVEKVKLQNTTTKEISEMQIDGVFVAIGHIPNTKVFQGINVNEKGYVLQEKSTHTNLEGIFVAGDVQDDRYMQAITAAGFGCMAALDIERWIREKQ